LHGLLPNTSYLVLINENMTHHLKLKNCKIKNQFFLLSLSIKFNHFFQRSITPQNITGSSIWS